MSRNVDASSVAQSDDVHFTWCGQMAGQINMLEKRSGSIVVMVIDQENVEIAKPANNQQIGGNEKGKVWSVEDEQDKIHDFSFIFSYFKWFYYIGVVPFKPTLVSSGNGVKLERNVIQMISCSLVYTGAVTWTGIKMTHAYPAETLYGRPSRILAVVSVLFQMSYVLSFMHKFWLQPSHSKNLLNCRLHCLHVKSSTQHLKTIPGTVTGKIFLSLFCCLPFLFTIVSSLIQFETLRKTRPGCLEASDELAAASCTLGEKFRYISSLTLILSAELIYNSFQTFVLLIVAIGKWMIAECTVASRKEAKCICALLSCMDNLRRQFSAIRQMTNLFLLCFLCQLIPWVGYRLLDSLPVYGQPIVPVEPSPGLQKAVVHDDYALLIKSYNWLVMFYYSIIVYYAVESKKYADEFRDNLVMAVLKREITNTNGQTKCLSIYHQSSLSQDSQTTFALTNYVEETMRDICFSGGPFFNYSYKFVGTIFGIIVTLILFELQFGRKEHFRHINS